MRRATLVFLAEDDDDLRALLARTLRFDGHAVVEARDGAELLGLLAAAQANKPLKPDVIVTDVLMPGYSGVGVLSALHASDWEVPVILITARNDAALDQDALRLGAKVVLHKPLDLFAVRAAVASASRNSPVDNS